MDIKVAGSGNPAAVRPLGTAAVCRLGTVTGTATGTVTAGFIAVDSVDTDGRVGSMGTGGTVDTDGVGHAADRTFHRRAVRGGETHRDLVRASTDGVDPARHGAGGVGRPGAHRPMRTVRRARRPRYGEACG